jgi:hypothetical protein
MNKDIKATAGKSRAHRHACRNPPAIVPPSGRVRHLPAVDQPRARGTVVADGRLLDQVKPSHAPDGWYQLFRTARGATAARITAPCEDLTWQPCA